MTLGENGRIRVLRDGLANLWRKNVFTGGYGPKRVEEFVVWRIFHQRGDGTGLNGPGKSVRTAVAREANSWTAEIVIPLAEFKKLVTAVPTSFARSRIVADKKGTSYYVWGPETIEAFGDSSNFGTVEY